ncbi:MAG TPA: amidohydrolase [Dehalococcoidia bacterium]|nr:amidohydrolase [Dehalococcoidia bacterium]
MTSTAEPAGPAAWSGRAEQFDLSPEVRAVAAETIATRRLLHHHAEPSWNEHWTGEAIEEHLRGFGYEAVHTYAETGRATLLRGGKPGPTVLYRADIDGLPLKEETGLEFASPAESGMHACGHDGHMAIALSLAKVLRQRREELPGNVYFVFQPAEEVVGGAKAMIEDGCLNNVDPVMSLGLHLISEQTAVTANITDGTQMAAAAMFEITITGKGGHGGMPHRAIDAVLVGAHVVTALQSIVARNVDPLAPAVVSVGKLEAGVKNNIVAETARLEGTVRTMDLPLMRELLERIGKLVAGVSEAFGATCTYRYDISAPPVRNDPRVAALVREQAAALLGGSRLLATPTTVSDDMALFLDEIPGCYYLFGAMHADPAKVFPHHHARFDIDDRVLPVAVELGSRVIQNVLRRGGIE